MKAGRQHIVKRKLSLCLILLASLLLIGCAGGEDSSSTSQTPEEDAAFLSKSQYLKQGNAICKKGFEEKDRAVKEVFEEGEGSEKEIAQDAAEAALPTFRRMIAGLRALAAPARERAQAERIIRQFEAALAKAEANPNALVVENPFFQPGRNAAAYGLEACV